MTLRTGLLWFNSSRVAWRLLAYSVEKLGSFVNSINFSRLSECNSLFLLRHVPAETSDNQRKGVFQQNRP